MKFGKFWLCAAIVLAVLADAGLRLAAQDVSGKFEARIEEDVVFRHAEVEGTGPQFFFNQEVMPGSPGAGVGFQFVASEMSFGEGVTKNAPYSADSSTEMTQILSDGNRIVRKSGGRLYRDGDGRTRREQTLGTLGLWIPAEEPQQLVFIHDPVAGVDYVLETKDKIARKLPGLTMEGKKGIEASPALVPPRHTLEFKGVLLAPPGEVKTESLGKQTVDSVEVEGTRTTMTIAAGKVGNEQPIQIVSERWFSPELKVLVKSEHNDPRFGKTVYQLTNISRDEPAKSLFEVPSDYTVKDEPILIHKLRHGDSGGVK